MFKAFIKSINEKGFFHLLSANYLIGFLGFASQLLVVKFLSPEEMGQIKVFQSYLAILSIFAGFGLNTAVLKICSENLSSLLKKQIFSTNFAWTILINLILLVGVWFVTKSVMIFDGSFNSWFRLYAFLIPANALTSLAICYLQALKKIQLMAKTQSLLRLFGIVVVIFATYICKFAGFIWATVVVGYVCLFAIIYIIKDDFVRFEQLFLERRNWSYGAWSTAANIVGALSLYMDIFILNQSGVDKKMLGFYSIATIFLMGLNFITQTVQAITTPYFSEKSNNREAFMVALKKYQGLLIVVSIVVGFAAFILIPFFINLFYGNGYHLVGEFFRVLVFKYVFMGSYSLIGVALLGLGKMKVNFFIMLFNTFFICLLSFLLKNFFGVWGVAYAQALGYLLNIFVVYLVGIFYVSRHFQNCKRKESCLAN